MRWRFLFVALTLLVVTPLCQPLSLPHLNRKTFLSTIPLLPLPALANAPIQVSDLEETKRSMTSFELKRESLGRPKPTRLFRRPLDQKLAVLCMRTSYSVLDDMDVVGMDQFQRDFFLIRSTYYENYVNSLGGSGVVKQGDLSDPNYFDYISFAQYRTINYELEKPAGVFKEQQPILPDDPDFNPDSPTTQFRDVLVRRPAELSDVKSLPSIHSQRTGDAILSTLMDTFSNTTARIDPSSTTMLPAVNQIINLFLISGYAVSGTATLSPAYDALTITLTNPATLWGERSLKKYPVTNCFLLKTVLSYLQSNPNLPSPSKISKQFTDTEAIYNVKLK